MDANFYDRNFPFYFPSLFLLLRKNKLDSESNENYKFIVRNENTYNFVK